MGVTLGTGVKGSLQAVCQGVVKSSGSLLRDTSGVALAEVRGVQVVAVGRNALDFNAAVAFDAKSSASHEWVSRFCGEWPLAFALMAFVVALAFANATLGCDRIETYLLFSALSAAIGKQLLASCSEHSNDMPTAIGSKASRRWPHYVLALAALFTVTFALECDIDLSQISSNETYPGFAQCSVGCDSCNFSLDSGQFQYGTVKCLDNVPCFMYVTGENVQWALYHSTLDGSQASDLSVRTVDAAQHPWVYAVIHAPAKRGNFRFEAHNVYSAVQDTTFHAVNTGVVDIVIDKHSLPWSYPAMQGIAVYASTADELNIVIGEDTGYGRNYDSSIECPAAGKCTWQSSGQRWVDDPIYMSNVYIIAFPGTEMHVICEDNADSCDDVFVRCHDTDDSCEMQYDSDWQCDGTLNAETECFANVHTMTTTSKPTYTLKPTTTFQISTANSHLNTTPVATVETSVEPQPSDDSQSGIPLMYVAIGGGICLVVVCCCIVPIVYLFAQRQLLKAQMSERDAAQSEFEEVATDKPLIEGQPNVEQPECGDQNTADGFDERPQSPQIEGRIKDAQPIDYDDSDEQLWIQMGPNTVGHTER